MYKRTFRNTHLKINLKTHLDETRNEIWKYFCETGVCFPLVW